uniref:Ovule protein n=1 Tax=Parascaris univalens TaxID=6257 RepID=A0A915ADF6_PARUN
RLESGAFEWLVSGTFEFLHSSQSWLAVQTRRRTLLNRFSTRRKRSSILQPKRRKDMRMLQSGRLCQGSRTTHSLPMLEYLVHPEQQLLRQQALPMQAFRLVVFNNHIFSFFNTEKVGR